jgi:hypothetical protein
MRTLTFVLMSTLVLCQEIKVLIAKGRVEYFDTAWHKVSVGYVLKDGVTVRLHDSSYVAFVAGGRGMEFKKPGVYKVTLIRVVWMGFHSGRTVMSILKSLSLLRPQKEDISFHNITRYCLACSEMHDRAVNASINPYLVGIKRPEVTPVEQALVKNRSQPATKQEARSLTVEQSARLRNPQILEHF